MNEGVTDGRKKKGGWRWGGGGWNLFVGGGSNGAGGWEGMRM